MMNSTFKGSFVLCADQNAAAADELGLDKTSFAALASLSHTLVLGAGMVCHHATRELLASTPSLIPTHAYVLRERPRKKPTAPSRC